MRELGCCKLFNCLIGYKHENVACGPQDAPYEFTRLNVRRRYDENTHLCVTLEYLGWNSYASRVFPILRYSYDFLFVLYQNTSYCANCVYKYVCTRVREKYL